MKFTNIKTKYIESLDVYYSLINCATNKDEWTLLICSKLGKDVIKYSVSTTFNPLIEKYSDNKELLYPYTVFKDKFYRLDVLNANSNNPLDIHLALVEKHKDFLLG